MRSTLDQRRLEKIWVEIGRNRIEERWIQHKTGWYGCQEPGKIIISPLNLVHTIIHECLHAAYPPWTEAGVERATTRVFDSLEDHEAFRLYDAYSRKVVRIQRPAIGEDE